MDNSSKQKSNPTNERRCLYCGQIASLIWVHGHGQCSACGMNVAECCQGETCIVAAKGQK
jgi:hypothetical protein